MYLAQNIKFLREHNGLTQLQLAEILGISKSNISKYESGSVEPNLDIITKSAVYFGVTLDELILKDFKPPIPVYINNIRFLRKKHNMTQEEMANLLGYRGKQGYSMIETGNSNISVENLETLADFFGVTLDQLVKHDLSKEDI